MKSLWENNFKPMATDTPKDIVQYQCSSLNELTKGIIVARITEYSEPIPSYTKRDQGPTAQGSLGEVPGGGFTFEFYISSIATPNYKYRVMYLQYGVSLYPLTIVMDETIAQELQSNQEVACPDQESFEAVLAKILNSKKVSTVISALLGNAAKEARAAV